MTQAAEDAPLRHPRLEIRRVLGAGGMGVVHAAYDPVLEREVAVKVIRVTGAASGARARILREARAIARISHPNVVHVYSADAFDDQVAIVMELVQGQTLRAWLAERPRTWQEIVAVFVEAGRGLAAAHDAGLVHRDFKPDNVMVRTDGRACVLDFGLARALEAQTADGATVPLTPETARAISAEATVTLEASAGIDHASPPDAPSRATATGALVGTPLYMAPEQHLGAPTDARADQFAFCVALYRALFGQHPFDDTTYATLVKAVVAGEYRSPTTGDVPTSVIAALRRGLRERPADRFDSMAELLQRARETRDRWRWLAAAAAAALVVVAIVVLFLATTGRSASPNARNAVTKTDVRTRLTSSGDVRWTRVSPDERWLLIGKDHGEFVLRDLTGRERDRIIYSSGGQHVCEPSWSWSSDTVVVQDEMLKARLVRIDNSRSPLDIPMVGCVVFATETELAAHWLRRNEIRFWDTRTKESRSCTAPGTDSWLLGIDARPDIGRLLLTTFDDRESRMRMWSMNVDCSDAQLIASLPRANIDALSVVSDTTRSRWGRDESEVIAPAEVFSPPSVQMLSIGTAAPHTRTPLLAVTSMGHFSLTRRGVIYASQGENSSQIWLKKKSGEFKRLSTDSLPRTLGSFTPNGDAIVFIEGTDRGRAVRTLSLEGGTTRTLSEHDGTDIVPSQVAMSTDGTLALVGSRQAAPVVSLIAPSGDVMQLNDPAGLSATDVRWVGSSLLLNLPGNRDFAVFEGGRRRRRNLLVGPRTGVSLAPVGAPDQDTVAFFFNRTEPELWLVKLSTGEERKLATFAVPLGWSRDGAWIYSQDVREPHRLVRISASDGHSEPWLEIPVVSRFFSIVVTPDGDAVIVFGTGVVDAYRLAGLGPLRSLEAQGD